MRLYFCLPLIIGFAKSHGPSDPLLNKPIISNSFTKESFENLDFLPNWLGLYLSMKVIGTPKIGRLI